MDIHTYIHTYIDTYVCLLRRWASNRPQCVSMCITHVYIHPRSSGVDSPKSTCIWQHVLSSGRRLGESETPVYNSTLNPELGKSETPEVSSLVPRRFRGRDGRARGSAFDFAPAPAYRRRHVHRRRPYRNLPCALAYPPCRSIKYASGQVYLRVHVRERCCKTTPRWGRQRRLRTTTGKAVWRYGNRAHGRERARRGKRRAPATPTSPACASRAWRGVSPLPCAGFRPQASRPPSTGRAGHVWAAGLAGAPGRVARRPSLSNPTSHNTPTPSNRSWCV